MSIKEFVQKCDKLDNKIKELESRIKFLETKSNSSNPSTTDADKPIKLKRNTKSASGNTGNEEDKTKDNLDVKPEINETKNEVVKIEQV